MNCEQIKPYLCGRALGRALGEDARDQDAEAHLAEAHLANCADCRAELADLELTQKLMRQGLPEEEPPRRIAFVADSVARADTNAAPKWNPLRLWQWSFAGAMAVAMLFAGLVIGRPAGVVGPAGGLAAANVAEPAGASRTSPVAAPAAAGFSRAQVDSMIAQAVAASEQRQRAETAAVIQAAAVRMSEQLHYLQSTQTEVYKQSEQNRSDLRNVAALINGRQGVQQ